jgi:hypothetical protein
MILTTKELNNFKIKLFVDLSLKKFVFIKKIKAAERLP